MELKEFVKETLLQIIQGVGDAQDEAEEYGAAINPGKITGNGIAQSGYNNKPCTVQNVDFEVVLSSATNESSKKGIGVMLESIGVGANKNTDGNNSTVTNIKFSIPIILPHTDNW